MPSRPKNMPGTDAERFTVLWDCCHSLKSALYWADRSSAAEGDPIDAVERFVSSATHVANALKIIEQARWPAGLQETRDKATAFRKLWRKRRAVEMRNAIEHREEAIWDQAHPLHGNLHIASFCGVNIYTSTGDGFVADGGAGPQVARYLGRDYDLSGLVTALRELNSSLLEAVFDNGKPRTTGLAHRARGRGHPSAQEGTANG